MKRKTIFYFILILLTNSALLSAEDKKTEQNYRKQILPIFGKITETITFRNKAKRGLLINIGHRITIYRYNKTLKKVYSFNSPRNTSVFDIGDINGDDRDDISFYDGKKIYFYFQNKNFKFIPKESYALNIVSSLPASRINMNRLHFLHDLDFDKKAEILFPGIDTITIYKNVKGKFEKNKNLNLQFKTTVSDRVWKNSDIRTNDLRIKVYIPKLYKIDINNDGYPDFYASKYNRVFIFLNNKKGSLKKPITKYFSVKFKNIYASYFSFKKLDNDNYFDAIFTIIKGSGVDIHTENYIFKGKKNLKFKKKVILHKESGGFFYPFTPRLKNATVLISPKIDIGLPFVISYLIQNKLRIRINQLKLEKNSIKEISSYILSYKVAGSLLPGFAQGDFNGDREEEFAVGINPNLLYIYKATNGKFTEEPAYKINCQSYGIIRKMDIDGNGQDDLIIVYPKANKKLNYKKNKITIIYF